MFNRRAYTTKSGSSPHCHPAEPAQRDSSGIGFHAPRPDHGNAWGGQKAEQYLT